MKLLYFFDDKTKPDYRNWLPKRLLKAKIIESLVCLILFILFGASDLILQGRQRIIWGIILGIGYLILLLITVWVSFLYRSFDYNGKRKLAKVIIEGTADYVKIPDGGVGLDVGCGSGALTIACAKKNPKTTMVGCDIWRGSYKSEFSKELCENNAKLEGIENVRFEEGNAANLPFEDESFDVVTSNYVYHNIRGKNKQKLLLETLRVLKKDGVFVIHDLMSKSRYGDMNKFMEKLKKDGYEDVQLIDTTKGLFMSHKESLFLGLSGSALLIGRK
ncbi:MAG: class I SAM-dependent methyltransferase [Anaerococcus vaginalis]|uniref:class I SAM-dependent methyltransferase n=1 Tax=Anaerococcus jeddahensis TaxID=1673719 RepID=UPI000672581D|nr:class I SAM-dependent methyltransferase [Anaerococcus jeddahensis]MDU5913510.1 class I SAM-dependent methyltransferase [Anaerococcus vaginalis]MDU6063923.1 class I SAM-dependent methyltransferase [Anaerococcus sp.]